MHNAQILDELSSEVIAASKLRHSNLSWDFRAEGHEILDDHHADQQHGVTHCGVSVQPTLMS